MSTETIPGPGWLLPAPAVVELAGVALAYPGPPPVTALHPVDLTVGRGELVIVTGQAGSGKTALRNLIGLLDRPTAGRYRLNGTNTAYLGERDRAALRARQFGLVFQQPRLLPSRSVVDNVALALLYHGLRERDRRRRAMEALNQAGLAGRSGIPAGRLSAGQRQLTCIARALAGRPSLMLCDEPTAGLDDAAAALVTELLAGWHRDGGTAVIVTSDRALAAHGTSFLAVGAALSADQSLGQVR